MSERLHPEVSIVIPTWNGRPLLERFLPSVMEAARAYRQRAARVEIWVIDDGSTDGTSEWLLTRYPEVEVVTKPGPEGFAPTANVGLRRARAPVIVLLNNDVAVEPDILFHLTPHFQEDSVFAVTCRALDPQSGRVVSAGKLGRFRRGFWRVHDDYDVPSDGSAATGPWFSLLASGGFSAFDAEKVRHLGGFDERLRPFYWEDVDLSLRAWGRGWEIRYEPRAIVYHQASRTIGERFAASVIRRISQRNRLLTHWKNLDERTWVLEHVAIVFALLMTSPLRGDWAFIAALLSAMRELPTILRERRSEREARRRRGRDLERLFRALGRDLDLRREVFPSSLR